MGQLLPGLRPNQWVQFEDANGPGQCEPDAFLVTPEEVLIFEVKLTACRYGFEQLEGLYAPLLGHLFKRPVRCLQIAKALHPGLQEVPQVRALAEFTVSIGPPVGLLHVPHLSFL